jgi:glycosyltransferase involved in cell wall biosynthesis
VHLHETADLAARVASGAIPGPLAAAVNGGGEGIYRLAIGHLLTSAFLKEHARQAFDLVEVPEVEALGLPLLINEAVRVPVVTHLHCATAIAYEGNDVAMGQRERLIAAMEWAAIALSDARCAPTRRVLELTQRHMGQSIDATIIPHALTSTTGRFSPPPPDGPVLFVGRLEKLKGCQILAAALVRFLTDNPTATFRFAAPDTNTAPGGGSMRQFVEQTLGPALLDRVTFLGEVSRETVAQELSAASFCVMPSMVENFSMALCEAMSAGRATIVADGTGSVEIVDEPALICSQGSAEDLAGRMTHLWRDRDQLARLSLTSYTRVQQLCDRTRVTTKRIAFYQRTIADFNAQSSGGRAARLLSLPPDCAAAILPAIVALTGTLCGFSDDTVQSPGQRMMRLMQAIAQRSGQPAKVLLYAAGKHTARLLSERQVWESAGHAVVGIIDDHPRFESAPEYLGLPVRSLRMTTESARAGQAVPPIILSTDTYQEQFWRQTAPLRQLGASVHRLYSSGRSAA